MLDHAVHQVGVILRFTPGGHPDRGEPGEEGAGSDPGLGARERGTWAQMGSAAERKMFADVVSVGMELGGGAKLAFGAVGRRERDEQSRVRRELHPAEFDVDGGAPEPGLDWA